MANRPVNSATLWITQSTPYTQSAGASSAARAASAVKQIATRIRTNVRSRPTRASRRATPTVVANIATPTTR